MAVTPTKEERQVYVPAQRAHDAIEEALVALGYLDRATAVRLGHKVDRIQDVIGGLRLAKREIAGEFLV